MAGQTGRVHPAALEKKTADLKPGKIHGDAKIARPKVTDKLVSEHEMNKPKGEVKFKEREIKRTGRAPREWGKAAPETGRTAPEGRRKTRCGSA